MAGAACVPSLPPSSRPLRSAVAADFPAFRERAEQLLDLAVLASSGPDPEALVPDVSALADLCRAFAQAHPSP